MDRLFRAAGHDLRHAVRQLRRERAFSAAAIAILAIPMTALATLFSLFNSIAVRPLPVPHPEELVHVSIADLPGSTGWRFPYASYGRLSTEQRVMTDVFGYTGGGVYALEARSRLVEGIVAAVTPEFFGALELWPSAGRLFTATDAPPDVEPAHVAVLSHRLWQRLFDGDVRAIGERLEVRGRTLTVIGVLPERFTGLLHDVGNDFYIPLTLLPFIGATPSGPPNPNVASLVGRLRPGVTVEQARASVAAMWPTILVETMPATLSPQDRKERGSLRLSVEPGGRGLSFLRTRYEGPLRMLTLLAGVLLLVGCANLGGLMYARLASSEAQWTVRLALGATRARLLQTLMFESVMLTAAAAAIAGSLLPTLSRTVGHALSTSSFLLDGLMSPDGRVYVFLMAASGIAAGIMGLVAAGALRRAAAHMLVRSATASAPRHLHAKVAVSLQVCGFVVLLFTAVLFTGSLVGLRTLDSGFRPDGLLFTRAWQLPGPPRVYDEASYYPALVEHLSALPGIRSVALSHYFPAYFNVPFAPQIDVRPSGLEGPAPVRAQREFVSPRFFETIGASILQGRDFTWSDRLDAPPVAIVSRALADRLFPAGGPVGSRIRVGNDATPSSIEVVGVSSDLTVGDLRRPRLPVIFRPRLQEPQFQRVPIVVVNAGSSAAAIIARVGPAIRSMGHEYTREILTVDEQLSQSTRQESLLALASLVLGGSAAMAAFLGLFAMLAYSVARRTREIGIRIAIGASPASVARLVSAQALTPVLAGLATGVPCALGAGRLAQSLLFGVQPSDPRLITSVALFAAGGAILAAVIPALRAVRINPVSALRAE